MLWPLQQEAGPSRWQVMVHGPQGQVQLLTTHHVDGPLWHQVQVALTCHGKYDLQDAQPTLLDTVDELSAQPCHTNSLHCMPL